MKKKLNALVDYDDSTYQNVLIVYFNPIETTLDDTIVVMDFEYNFILRHKRCVIIHESQKLKWVPSESRIYIGNWTKRHRELLKERLAASIFVSSNPIIQILLKTTMVIEKTYYPQIVLAKMEEALDSAKNYLNKTSVI